jgi:hypothetical protein
MIFYLLFALALIHNILLIFIFYVRKHADETHSAEKKIGFFYIPISFILATIALIWGIMDNLGGNFIVFVIIFMVYLIIETLLDFVLKTDFRSNIKVAIPYVILYYMANYCVVMLVWLENITAGVVVLILMIIQYIMNAWSHPKPGKRDEKLTGIEDKS